VTAVVWLLPILLPVVGAAAALVVPGRWRAAIVAVAAVPALLLAAAGAPGPPPDLTWLLLDVRLELDPVGRALLLAAAIIWTAAGVAARPTVRTHPGFAALWSLTLAGNVAAVLADDVVTLYAAFGVMTFAAYGLVVHQRTSAALRAGRVYVVVAVAAEVAVLIGLVLAVGLGVRAGPGAGPAALTGLAEVRAVLADDPAGPAIAVLLLIGFGAKLGLVPLHGWLPLAHPEAPTPASAVLSGAMIKVGLLGWLRLLPLGDVAWPSLATTWVVLGLAAALLGAGLGVASTEPKVVLAYSSVSQVGLLTAVVGVGLAAPAAGPVAVAAATVGAVHHGLAKALLFLAVGLHGEHGAPPDAAEDPDAAADRDAAEDPHAAAAPDAAEDRDPAAGPDAGGTARARRVRLALLAAVAVGGLALAGVPLTSGWLAKEAMTDATGALGGPAGDRVARWLSVAAVGTTLLLARLGWLLGRPARRRPDAAASGAAPSSPPGPTWAALAGLTVAVAVGTWGVVPRVGPLDRPTVTWSTVWDGLWPVLVGLALAAVAVALARTALARGRRVPTVGVPPGDLVVPVERVAGRVGAAASRTTSASSAALDRVREAPRWPRWRRAAGRLADHLEERLTRWRVAGAAFALIGAALLATVALG
jgi:hydrogenase-4 component B